MPAKRVVIVGAGFGGLSAAKRLAKNRSVEILVVDRRNHSLFQPLLYQVATAGLSPADIAVPIRAELSGLNHVQVHLGNVVNINLAERWVRTEAETLFFDYLILACGATHSYFGHPEWEKLAPGLKSLENATEIRRRILLAYELAERETDSEKQRALLTFVVIGGGPTGVELAGAIAEISRFTLEKDFRRIDPTKARVILIEAGERILSAFAPELSKKATRDLERLGVHVWTGTRVTNVTDQGVDISKEFIRAHTLLWAAGVQPSPLGAKLSVELDRIGRVIVGADLSIPGHPNVFVIGDQASVKTSDSGTLPGLAPVAIQEGRHTAKNILLDLQGRSRLPFSYRDKGMLATIGRSRAVMQIGSLRVGGFFAWAGWLFVHIYYLVGFKNKTFVFLNWTWSYVTFKRGARLIVERE
jgi:NADH:ubiquinone reductase (H+-translocating)